MRWLDILLGKTGAPRSSFENLFGISTAQITLAAKLEVKPTGNAGIVFKPVEASSFAEAEKELKGLLDLTAGETGTEFHLTGDAYGYRWVALFDKDFEDLVAALHMTSQTLQERGFGTQLLVAIFQFAGSDNRDIYWIYTYKRGCFYPFVPLPEKSRDNALELRLRALMESELPLEPDLERWYPLWDIPFNRERDPAR